MAYEIPGTVVSLLSGSTTLKAYRIVRVSALNTVVQTTGLSTGASAVFSVGVTQNGVPSPTTRTGLAVSVMVTGVTKVAASSRAIAAGNLIRATSGAAATSGGLALPSSNSTPHVVGVALTSCAAGTIGARFVSMRLF